MRSDCLACGGRHPFALPALWSGAVGPFCSAKCKAANDHEHNQRVWDRATAYSSRVMTSASASEIGLTESDIARAFVIGYAAGLEDGCSMVGRRTVRK